MVSSAVLENQKSPSSGACATGLCAQDLKANHAKPDLKPNNPCFSSGPCAKRLGWSLHNLEQALVGRSHRAGVGKARLKEVIETHRRLLGIPDSYKIGILPASDTGAFELAMWNLIGGNTQGTDVLAWDVFGLDWMKDLKDQLKPNNLRIFKAPYGALPPLEETKPDHDIVFVWNGTTAGVRVPDGSWISPERRGLTLCDATSAVFAVDLPWEKLDVITWSWQKVLGGEAAHGMLVLSPRAIERLESYTPAWSLPKIFRIKKNDGTLNEGIFKGETINTPSMLAVEDCLDSLRWIETLGGLSATIARSNAHMKLLQTWVDQTPWVDFLAEIPQTRSTTSVCLKIVDPWFVSLPESEKMPFVKTMTNLLEKEGVAYDIAGHRDAPAGIRLWCGATIEESDLRALLPWLDWAYAQAYQKAQTSS